MTKAHLDFEPIKATLDLWYHNLWYHNLKQHICALNPKLSFPSPGESRLGKTTIIQQLLQTQRISKARSSPADNKGNKNLKLCCVIKIPNSYSNNSSDGEAMCLLPDGILFLISGAYCRISVVLPSFKKFRVTQVTTRLLNSMIRKTVRNLEIVLLLLFYFSCQVQSFWRHKLIARGRMCQQKCRKMGKSSVKHWVFTINLQIP